MNQPNEIEYPTISKYDRVRAGLQGANNSLFTRPSTVKTVQFITGKTETFVIETCRHDDLGDHVFIECVDENGTVRLALPPKVANAIAAQRDSLTTRRRSIAAKTQAKARMDRGELPGFMKAGKRKHATVQPSGARKGED